MKIALLSDETSNYKRKERFVKVIVIVDAYSSGKNLVYAFRAYGYSLVHVQSPSKLPKICLKNYHEIKQLFIETIVFNTLENVIKQLEKYDVKFVISGSEPGVIITDDINDYLRLSVSNDKNFSLARRNKCIMHAILDRENIASISYYKASQIQDLLNWVDSEISGFKTDINPVVLKPLQSSMTDNVFFCYSKKEVIHAYNKIIHSEDVFGQSNIEVLAQPYVKGEEYIVNTVSHNGLHFVTDVWHIRKKKIKRIPIYDFEELVLPNDPVYETVTAYTKSVLDTLKIKFGASHTELFLNENGPVLIETGARLMGTCDFSAVAEVMGYNQVSILVESYLHPKRFLKYASEKKTFKKKYIRNIFLISNISGKMTKQLNKDLFKDLRGFHSLSFAYSLGDIIPETKSLISSPGYIYLISENPQDLIEGYEFIRKQEEILYHDLTG